MSNYNNPTQNTKEMDSDVDNFYYFFSIFLEFFNIFFVFFQHFFCIFLTFFWYVFSIILVIFCYFFSIFLLFDSMISSSVSWGSKLESIRIAITTEKRALNTLAVKQSVEEYILQGQEEGWKVSPLLQVGFFATIKVSTKILFEFATYFRSSQLIN